MTVQVEDLYCVCVSSLNVDCPPSSWSKEEVMEWAMIEVQRYSLHQVKPDDFNMTGMELSLLTKEQFCKKVANVHIGELLYQDITERNKSE